MLAALAAAVALAAFMSQFGRAQDEPTPIFVTQMPSGYREWRVIAVAHEEGNLNSLGAILGNDVAIKAYRDATLPYPDGTIIAALHDKNVPSEENDKVFGRAQSFVPGPATNIQFMIKDSKKYAATGGLGIRPLQHRRHTWQRHPDENLLPLPRPSENHRPRLHALRAVILSYDSPGGFL
jgi:Cytochrome P460